MIIHQMLPPKHPLFPHIRKYLRVSLNFLSFDAHSMLFRRRENVQDSRAAIPETRWHEVPLPERFAYGIKRLAGRRKIFSRFKFF